MTTRIDEQWVKEHGSRRLRLALEHGLLGQCRGIYRDERVAAVFPGYRFGTLVGPEAKRERAGDLALGGSSITFVDPWNPPLEALEALEAERKQYFAALMAIWKGPGEGPLFVLVLETEIEGLGRCIIYRPAVKDWRPASPP